MGCVLSEARWEKRVSDRHFAHSSLLARRSTVDRREDGVVPGRITHGGVVGEGLGEGRAGEEEGAESDKHGGCWVVL
jgi:hypothetical protein